MPARLACVKPAASVRSEPGSNSQVGLETSNRLITTFLTRSHHFLLAEANKLSAIHIADNDGVTFKTCTAEVFRPVSKNQKPKFSINRGSQGLRRPRFSFFIFTCQTARGPKTPLPFGGATRPKPSKEAFSNTSLDDK